MVVISPIHPPCLPDVALQRKEHKSTHTHTHHSTDPSFVYLVIVKSEKENNKNQETVY